MRGHHLAMEGARGGEGVPPGTQGVREGATWHALTASQPPSTEGPVTTLQHPRYLQAPCRGRTCDAVVPPLPLVLLPARELLAAPAPAVVPLPLSNIE